MEEQLISFETAKLAKEKGFNEIDYYFQVYLGEKSEGKGRLNNWKNFLNTPEEYRKDMVYYIATPQSFLQKWLREKHNIFVEIQLDQTSYPKFAFEIYKFKDINIFEKIQNNNWFLYRTYEEALEEALKVGLKSIKRT